MKSDIIKKMERPLFINITGLFLLSLSMLHFTVFLSVIILLGLFLRLRFNYSVINWYKLTIFTFLAVNKDWDSSMKKAIHYVLAVLGLRKVPPGSRGFPLDQYPEPTLLKLCERDLEESTVNSLCSHFVPYMKFKMSQTCKVCPFVPLLTLIWTQQTEQGRKLTKRGIHFFVRRGS